MTAEPVPEQVVGNLATKSFRLCDLTGSSVIDAVLIAAAKAWRDPATGDTSRSQRAPHEVLFAARLASPTIVDRT